MQDPVTELRDKIANCLRAYLRAPEADQTAILREAAGEVVRLREHFTTPDGDIDWRGNSWHYKRRMGEAYSMAGVIPDDVNRVRNALSYHVSNLLREQLPPETLEDLGLRPLSARERAAEVRESWAAERQVARHVLGSAGSLPALEALTAALQMLIRVREDELRAMPKEDRADARKVVEGLRREADRLGRAAGERRRDG